jgi:hypothetical protein
VVVLPPVKKKIHEKALSETKTHTKMALIGLFALLKPILPGFSSAVKSA